MDSLNCPLTCDIFHDPVIGQDGHTYERKDITDWLQQHGTSPITREPMKIESLRPNHIVRKIIEEFDAVSKKKDYQFRLDIDVHKTDTQPWYQTRSKAIYKAEWIGRQGPPIVLIKIDGAKANREALFYVQLSCHPHIVRTFGLVESDINSVMLVQEYAEKGNLAVLLRENKFKPTRNVLIEIFTQIIDAMICLADNKIVHGGLACQNVLVFRCNSNIPEENLVKLTDFGLTKGSDIFSAVVNSSQTTMNIIPVRYAAVEILRTNGDRMSYSEKSDVYSMAVLMWEACSYGTRPFASSVDDNDVYRCKLRGDQLPRPTICDEDLWSVIIHCWRPNSVDRPTFKELRRIITGLAGASNSTSSNPVLESPKISHVPPTTTCFIRERSSSVKFEIHEDKIPCEYCDELVDFDQYITHILACTSQDKHRVIEDIRSSESMQTTTTKTQLAYEPKWGQGYIEITVSYVIQTTKGLFSSTVYRIMTRSSFPIFKKAQFGVNRRFIDFLGVHGKLVVKYLPEGIIIPALPENDASIVSKDAIERQRAQLERYLNRLARNKTLLCDPNFVMFLELPEELSKMTSNTWRDLLSVSIIKIQERDWFDEKQKFIINLQTDLKELKSKFDYLYKLREESNARDRELIVQLNNLAVCEDHSVLSSALIELAAVQKKLEQINSDRTQQEFLSMNELINEYILHLDMVKCAFNERAKFHKSWLLTTDTFRRKLKEKGSHVELEAENLQKKIISEMENFQRISTILKQQVEVFEESQAEEFKKNIRAYIKQMLEQQEKVLEIWETYVPIAKNIALSD